MPERRFSFSSEQRHDQRGGSRTGDEGLAPTHEPPLMPKNGKFPQIEVFLTDDSVLECLGVKIHGQLHYLHATSARALEKRIHENLERWNAHVRELKRERAGMPGVDGLQEV